nr:hypothetical protein [Tanacetum cinerariifolium]
MKRLINSEYRNEIKIDELKENFNSMSIEINKKEKLQQLEHVANLSTYPSKHFNSFCYDDDDDEDYNFAITPNKPDNSLSMGDEHPDTILAMESNEFIKSSVENLIPISSEPEGESEYDVPAREEVTTFLNILFDAEYEFDSSNDQSFYDEDVPKKIFSNPLFDEEIIPMKIDQHQYNDKSDLIESLRTHDSSIIISSKIDSLFDEFAGELALLKSIPSRIDVTDCDFEEEIRLVERLLYDNSSPRPPEEFVFANSDTEIESFSPSPVPFKDSDSLMEEIDLSFTLDYPMPPGIEDDDYDSERDIIILKDLLSNDTLSLSEKESFHFDIPSFSCPLTKPPDGIDKTDCYHEEDIRLIERLLYDNSSPRPPEEFVFENSKTDIESFSPSPIPVDDSDSFMKEIDLTFNLDDPMPPGIEDDDDDYERDILILKDLPSNYSLSLPQNKSFYFDIPSLSHPPAKPPDGKRKSRKGQNWDETGQKQEAWRNREKSKTVTANGCLFLLGFSGVDDGKRGLMEMGKKMAEKVRENGQKGDGGKIRRNPQFDLLKRQEAENCHEKAHHTYVQEYPPTHLGLEQVHLNTTASNPPSLGYSILEEVDE